VSVQHDKSPDDLRVGTWIPTQRTGSTPQTPPTPNSPPSPPPSTIESANEQTVVLPVFVTGKKPEKPPAHQAMAETSLPSSERGMLLFVAALLGLGTVAVVAMMGFGLGGSTKPKPPVAASTTPAPVVAAPLPSPEPSLAPSPGKPSPSRSPAARHSPSPSSTFLGALSNSVLVGFCQDTNNGMPFPPRNGRSSWACLADRGQRQEFAPTDVCQWRYRDGGARAVVADITSPPTWRCYT
jgi:hypothetical protein